MLLKLLALVCVGVVASSAAEAAPRGVTVFLDGGGRALDDGDAIPPFGGGARAWSAIRACVAKHYAPFAIDVVDEKPRTGDYITVVVGGRASQLGLDDRTHNGIAPYLPGSVLRTAVVHVFSKVGTGERDVQNVCEVAVHESAHAMGLDHTYKCGDIMSYLEGCGPARILDLDMPCGEYGKRECGDGARTQNSFRKLAAAVGLRGGRDRDPEPDADVEPERDMDPDLDLDMNPKSDVDVEADPDIDVESEPDPFADADDDVEPTSEPYSDTDEAHDDSVTGDRELEDAVTVRGADGYLYRVSRVQKNGRTWIVVERIHDAPSSCSRVHRAHANASSQTYSRR
ncbi:MAG: hypothetical protein ACKV2T_01835 [Kofleriaceae bacterium]